MFESQGFCYLFWCNADGRDMSNWFMEVTQNISLIMSCSISAGLSTMVC
jgi:hypothetical protein